MPISKRTQLASLALCLNAAIAGAAPMTPPAVGSYLNGGIGLEERQTMQAERQRYNLQLRFARARTGEYLTGVDLLVEPLAKRQPSLRVADAGPLLYAHLPAGSYRISASYEGKTQVRQVRLGRAATEYVFYWP